MDLVILVFSILLAALLYLGYALLFAEGYGPRSRTRRPVRRRSRESIVVSVNPWQAVSFEGECAAVRAIATRRFLVREAPSLPLPDCQARHCRCRSIHHEDRRTGPSDRRRRPEAGHFSGGDDRRVMRGRRAEDLAFNAA